MDEVQKKRVRLSLLVRSTNSDVIAAKGLCRDYKGLGQLTD